MKRTCAMDGCDRPVFHFRQNVRVARKRIGSDDDHDLCQKHYDELRSAMHAKQLKPRTVEES